MKTIRCIIADDELFAREILESYVQKLPNLELVATCTNGVEVFNRLLTDPVDLLFLDIQMPQMNGLELLKSLTNSPAVILTTAYREFALESYDYKVIDYLLKPISFQRFVQALSKFESFKLPAQVSSIVEKQKNEIEDRPFIYIKSDRKMVKVFLSDILFIEGLKDYVKIHTPQKTFITYDTLTYFEDKLSAKYFARAHRSFIVGLQHITSHTKSQLNIGDILIPIGASYSTEFLKRIGSF